MNSEAEMKEVLGARSHSALIALEGTIPWHMHEGLLAYLFYGRPPGDFLAAVLKNDLVEAFARADGENTRFMRQWAAFLYSHMPALPVRSWGGSEAYKNWIEIGGLEGLIAKAKEINET